MLKKRLTGTVTSAKTLKTLVVLVERMKEHPKYKKMYRARKKYKAHYEGSDYKVGDKVMIEECRPISKDKHWKVVVK